MYNIITLYIHHEIYKSILYIIHIVFAHNNNISRYIYKFIYLQHVACSYNNISSHCRTIKIFTHIHIHSCILRVTLDTTRFIV